MHLEPELPSILRGARIHLVGAKGTGMTALAEILADKGAILTGSDVADVFYTDEILARVGVPLAVGFDPSHVHEDVQIIIHSAAYSPESNPELLEARRRGIPILNYPEALGSLSRRHDSSGIAGVHGKTTTTALAGSILAALELPATILAGSAVSSFGNSCTRIVGDTYFVAETCEYRKHFLHFSPRRIILTSVEPDHQDFFPRYEDIRDAFVEYGLSLAEGGELIYCSDDHGAEDVVQRIQARRPDLIYTPYGRKAPGFFRLLESSAAEGQARFRIQGISEHLALKVPGEHIVLDAIAALALSLSIMRGHRSPRGSHFHLEPKDLLAIRKALAEFRGSKRRSEIIGEAEGILVMDDYGHHPTAIAATIRGIKDFWPDRRLVVDFMSHTYSRTEALFEDFAASLDDADELVMHKIYASARERPVEGVSGRSLAEAARRRGAQARHGGRAQYFEEPLDALGYLAGSLRQGDLFLTMGAGDNWKLGKALLELLQKESS